MKVWWVLKWESYYPEGGLDNVHSTYATEAEAKAEAERLSLDPFGAENIQLVNVSNLLGIEEKLNYE